MADPFAKYEQKADPFAKYEQKQSVSADPFAKYESPTESPDYQKLQGEMEKGIVEQITESPLAVSGIITDAEYEAIARKHGVPTASLKRWTPFLGGQAERPEDGIGAALGEAGLAVAGTAGNILMGVPQKLAKKTQSPEMERALDDIQRIADARKSLLQSGIENVIIQGPALVGRGLVKGAAAGATMGALGGAAGSRQGEEARGALFSSILGSAVGGVVGKATARAEARAATKAAEQLEKRTDDINKTINESGQEFRNIVDAEIATKAPVDNALEKVIFDGQPLDPDTSYLIARSRPEMLDKMADASTDEGAAFLGKLERRMGKKASSELSPTDIQDLAARELAADTIRSAENRFANDIGITNRDDIRGAIQKWAGETEASGQGIQYARNRFRESQKIQHSIDALENAGLSTADGGGVMSKILDTISDAQYVLRSYDEKFHGLGAEDAHKAINRGINLMSYPREAFRKDIRSVFNTLRKGKLDSLARNGEDVIQAVEKGKALTSTQKAVYAPFDQFYSDKLNALEKLAKDSNVTPLAIKKRDNYLPSQLKDTYALELIMDARINKMLDEARQFTGKPIRSFADISPKVFELLESANKDNAETIRFIRSMSPREINTPADMSKEFIKIFKNPEGEQRLETLARAALEREDLIPMWARETDLYKLADKWTVNTLRHLFLREGIDKLRGKIPVLESIGANREADYVRKLIQDITGIRKGTAASAISAPQRKWMAFMDTKIRNTPEGSPKRIALETARAMPIMLQSMSRNVYENLLGAYNPHTILQNLTQPITKTIPEMGGAYGSLTAMRAAVNLGGLRGIRKAAEAMRKQGLAPAEFTANAMPYLQEGLARTGAARVGKAGLDAIGRVGMVPYQLAETGNRTITWAMGHTMADDLSRSPGKLRAMAEKSLSQFPESVQFAVRKAGNDTKEVGRILSEHLVNTTQYQYNRASMSEYGRTMGSLFSTFSKWPTATAGQVIESFRTHGLSGGAQEVGRQLVGPLVLLDTADWLLGSESMLGSILGEEPSAGDRQKKLLSNAGLSQAAPIGNLKSIATGDFFTPPVLDTTMRAINAFNNKDVPAALATAAANATYMFSPGGLGGWTRFVTNDITTMLTGEKPTGNFFERTAEGASTLRELIK